MNKVLSEFDYYFFDLDGTLINTEILYYRFWKEALNFYQYYPSHDFLLSLRSQDGRITKEQLKELGLDYDLVKAKRIELMDDYLKTHPIEVKPFVEEFLQLLKKNNKHVYLVSANLARKSKKILSSLHLLEYFDDIFSAKDVSIGKPSPLIYKWASKQINVDPQKILVFEDAPNGIISAYEANCQVIGVKDLGEYDLYKDKVLFFISSFEEMLI